MNREPETGRASPTYRGEMDAELVARTLAGENAAFDALVVKYRERVYSLAFHMLRNEQEALDVSQEVFMRAYFALGKFRGESGFFTWLYRIAVNLVYTHAKRESKRRELNVKAAGDGWGQVHAAVKTPEELAEKNEIQAALHRALQALDLRFREVLVLKEIEGLEVEEVAEVLGLPQGTVKSRLFRARRQLKGLLAGCRELAPPEREKP